MRTSAFSPAWTLTQTDTGSSPDVSVPIATPITAGFFSLCRTRELGFRTHAAPSPQLCDKLLPGAAMLADRWKEFGCST